MQTMCLEYVRSNVEIIPLSAQRSGISILDLLQPGMIKWSACGMRVSWMTSVCRAITLISLLYTRSVRKGFLQTLFYFRGRSLWMQRRRIYSSAKAFQGKSETCIKMFASLCLAQGFSGISLLHKTAESNGCVQVEALLGPSYMLRKCFFPYTVHRRWNMSISNRPKLS